MKTNEDTVPWDPQQEDQKVDGRNLKTGVDQLERDTLRFLELIPDVKMADVRIATNVAFPLAHESSDRALTKDDFEPENAKVLLEKLGVPIEYLQARQTCGVPVLEKQKTMDANLTAVSETTYRKMVCRYLGAHSKVSANVEIGQGLEVLEMAIKGTEGGYQAQDSLLCVEEKVDNVRKAVADDPRMREIRRAVLMPKFGTRFQKENPNLPLKDLKSDTKQFLKHLPSKRYPLFGLPVIRAVIGATDSYVVHQGAEAITELLEKQKYIFFNEKGDPLDLKTTVDEHIQDCIECSDVQDIKRKVPSSNDEHHVEIPEAFEHEVLLFADRKHRGFAEAYRRVKSWASFPDLKRKVIVQFIQKI